MSDDILCVVPDCRINGEIEVERCKTSLWLCADHYRIFFGLEQDANKIFKKRYGDVPESTRSELAADDQHEELVAEVERLKRILHLDRTGMAKALNECRSEAQSRLEITEGRGSYEWDDDRYRREAGYALQAIIAICADALRDSGNLAHAECCGRKGKE